MGKLPYIHFYTGDWLKDPALTRCSSATRGVWIDLLCVIHEDNCAGELRGTIEQLARMARVLPENLVHALTELQTTGAAEVRDRNGTVTVVSRRMSREAKLREDWKIRQKRKREKRNVTQNVTPKSPGLSLSLSLKSPPTPQSDNSENGAGKLKIFLEAYPAHRRTKVEEIRIEFAAINPDTALLARMISVLEAMKSSEEWQRESGRYIPGAANWLKSRPWEGAEIEAELSPDPPGSDPKPPKDCEWERDEAGEIIHPMRARRKV